VSMAALRGRAELILLLALVQGASAAPEEIVLDVPFVTQARNGCGPACVSMVMKYWAASTHRLPDAAAEESSIRREMLVPGSEGASPAEVVRYLTDHGFRAYAFHGEWADLEHHLSRGRPLIVGVGQGSDRFHYLVAAGIDNARGILLANDPALRKLRKLRRGDFEKAWSRCRFWTLLALPRDEN
jgi:predicted double-glycine peptidase